MYVHRHTNLLKSYHLWETKILKKKKWLKLSLMMLILLAVTYLMPQVLKQVFPYSSQLTYIVKKEIKENSFYFFEAKNLTFEIQI